MPLAWAFPVGAGDENRTRVASLEDWGSTIELHPQATSYDERADMIPHRPVTDQAGSRSPSRRVGSRAGSEHGLSSTRLGRSLRGVA
jgi:hypothetical protein